jgi:hypothetical protein
MSAAISEEFSENKKLGKLLSPGAVDRRWNSLHHVVERERWQEVTPKTMRVIGIVFMLLAAVVAVLNLRRVANLGAFYLPALLIVLGAAFILRARNRRL